MVLGGKNFFNGILAVGAAWYLWRSRPHLAGYLAGAASMFGITIYLDREMRLTAALFAVLTICLMGYGAISHLRLMAKRREEKRKQLEEEQQRLADDRLREERLAAVLGSVSGAAIVATGVVSELATAAGNGASAVVGHSAEAATALKEVASTTTSKTAEYGAAMVEWLGLRRQQS